MKLITILLLVFLMQVSARGFSQKITINKNKATLEDVLLEINRQAAYSYSVSYDILHNAKVFDINVMNASINEIFAICLKDQPLTYFIKDNIIFIKNTSLSSEGEEIPQSIDVKGRILNENNEPAIVTIQEKGTSNGVSSNSDGYFLLKKVSTKAILVISGVSIKTLEVKVDEKNDLGNIIVESKETTIAGVVVSVIHTGISTENPNKVIGSFTVVDQKKLNERADPLITNRLIGQVNGLSMNPGKTDASGRANPITIRSISTINGSPSPLIILDKFRYEGNIENINPNDIESITILKDAAATAIYGSLGGNGVIVITTQKGSFNEKVRIGMNSNIIITDQPDLYYQPRINSSDYIDVEQFLFNKGYDFRGALSNSYSPITPAVETFLKRRAGLITSADSAMRIDAMKNIDSRKQMDDFFYSKALTQQYSLNVNGGSKSIAWLISGSYNKALSSLESKSDKINFRLNNTYIPFKNAEIGFGFYYTNSFSTSGKPDPQSLQIRNAPYLSFVDENGSPLAIPSRYRSTFSDSAGHGNLLNWNYYPLYDYKHDVTKSKTEQIIGDIDLRYKILEGLNFSLSYQYQRQSSENERHADLQSYYARDLINSFTNLNVPSNMPELRNPVPLGGILTIGNSAAASHNFRALVQGNKTTRDDVHYFSGLLGFDLRNYIGNPGRTSTVYGYNDNPSTSSPVDFRRGFPNYVAGNALNIPGRPIVGPSTNNRNVSIYGNAAYIYKSKYFINVSARKDASNIFGLSTNDKWNPLWSAGLGWELSGEKFYNINALSKLRLRATWGYSGNVDESKVSIVNLRYFGAVNEAGLPYSVIANPTNKELRWEKVRQLNLGIDFQVKDSRVSGTIEYYKKWGIDLYGETFYDYTTYGLSSGVLKNVANTVGNGFDVQFQTVNIDRSFKWVSNFIINYSTSKTSKYLKGNAISGTGIIGGEGSKISPVVGKPLYAIAAYRWAGLDASGNPQGYVDGKISTNYNQLATASGIYDVDIIYKGSAIPVYFGSISNQVSWKNFTVSFNVMFRAGYFFKKPTISYSDLIESGLGHGDFEKRWQQPGDERITNVPSFVYPVSGLRDYFYQGSAVNVLKGDHLRLNYINFVYTLKKLQLYINLSDMGIIWRANHQKIDPDYPNTPPPPKSFAIGLRTTL